MLVDQTVFYRDGDRRLLAVVLACSDKRYTIRVYQTKDGEVIHHVINNVPAQKLAPIKKKV